ncbi:MAG: C4-dicarboxylate ABC transporter permease [Bdellovibrionaceae bacterium]|nr:C4-dicarboxylate ABC transporter permease [Pseudobdellovibrionaceae bacterium]|tara:strand:- start:140316 stop:140804 length:489 start_codon:yes stop_codon:yes gene_type:complete
MANRAKYYLKNFEEIICGTFLITMVSIVIVNVSLRYLFNYSIYWAEEVPTICFVWLTFVGAAAVYKHKMDIGIDVLILKMPEMAQKYIRLFVSVLLLLINGYIFYMSIVFTHISWSKPTAVLGVSSAVFNSALIFGFGLMTFHTIGFIKADILKLGEESKGA